MEPRLGNRRRLKWLCGVIAFGLVAIALIWTAVPAFRVSILCTMATSGIRGIEGFACSRLAGEAPEVAPMIVNRASGSRADDDSRAQLLATATHVADADGIGGICEAMTAEDPAFALLVFIYVREVPATHFDERMKGWLRDETVVFPNDSTRQLRRCDLAAYYFSPLLGYKAFDKMDCLAMSVEARNAFRARVLQRIDSDDSLPQGDQGGED